MGISSIGYATLARKVCLYLENLFLISLLMMQITKLMGSYYLTKTSIYLVCLSSRRNHVNNALAYLFSQVSCTNTVLLNTELTRL